CKNLSYNINNLNCVNIAVFFIDNLVFAFTEKNKKKAAEERN
ncbi:unnamed protein product, partial [marine sediment metagenome]